jgi:hypothetical protein
LLLEKEQAGIIISAVRTRMAKTATDSPKVKPL